MSTFICQASPLSKIFIPHLQAKCLDDPAIIVDGTPFTVRVKRPVGSIELTHNKPVIGSSLISRTILDDTTKKSFNRKIEDDEVAPLVAWLTDERNHETDIYGIVAVAIETNVADAIMALIAGEDTASQQRQLLAEIKKKMVVDIKDARERADIRVMRQCDKMYRVVKDTVNAMKKEGKGVYAPSFAEALAAGVIQHQYIQRSKYEDKASKLFDSSMANMAGAPTPA